MSSLTINKVNKSFGEQRVLDDISIEVTEGEFFSLLGPSGCGKTTLLRIIAGLETPDTGSIVINGSDYTNLPPQERNTGIVFQNYALFPHMTVAKNVAYGLEVKKLPAEEIENKVFTVLEKVRLLDKENSPVTSLSGGEQQRVSLARVIVTEPQLILFDEPLSNLDYALRLEMRSEIKRLQKDSGITSVYVTHDQSEALALSDRIAVMNKGHIIQLGTPSEVYYEPADIFAAEFVGHANIFDSKNALDILDIDIQDNEAVAVLPEELMLQPVTSNPKGKITDVQFSGFSVEYTIDASGKTLTALSASEEKNAPFKIGDSVDFAIPADKLRKLNK